MYTERNRHTKRGGNSVKKVKTNYGTIAGLLAVGMAFTLVGYKNNVDHEKEVYASMNKQTTIEQTVEVNREESPVEQEPIVIIGEDEIAETEIENNSKYNKYCTVPAVQATNAVNVRQGPSKEYDVIGGLTTHERMPLVQIGEEWDKINYYGKEAYVCRDFVEETDMIIGEPTKVVYCHEDTILKDEEDGTNYLVPIYELGLVYDETNDYYLADVNDRMGLIPKASTTELKGAYAVVDISDQRVDVYHDNELLLSTPCVTGKDSSPTTVGYHTIHSEKHHDYLIGDGYKSYVDHFLAFHNGEGLHDASWRSIFGGENFHESGSHGCVNLPSEVIEDVNDSLEVGDHVLVKR